MPEKQCMALVFELAVMCASYGVQIAFLVAFRGITAESDQGWFRTQVYFVGLCLLQMVLCVYNMVSIVGMLVAQAEC